MSLPKWVQDVLRSTVGYMKLRRSMVDPLADIERIPVEPMPVIQCPKRTLKTKKKHKSRKKAKKLKKAA